MMPTSTVASVHKPRSGLFDLPLELRQIIYREVLIETVTQIFEKRQKQDLKALRYEYVGDRVNTESKYLPTTIYVREKPRRPKDLKFPAMSYVWGSHELSSIFTVCRQWCSELQSVMSLHFFTCFMVIDEPCSASDWKRLICRLPASVRHHMRNLEVFAFVRVAQDADSQSKPLIGENEAATIRELLPNLRKVTMKFGQYFEKSDYYSLGNPVALRDRRLRLQASFAQYFGEGVKVICPAPADPIPYFAPCHGYEKPLSHQAMLSLLAM